MTPCMSDKGLEFNQCIVVFLYLNEEFMVGGVDNIFFYFLFFKLSGPTLSP